MCVCAQILRRNNHSTLTKGKLEISEKRKMKSVYNRKSSF